MTEDALQQLIEAELTGQATDQQSADLAARIKSDPAAARDYTRAVFLHAQLRQTLTAAKPAARSASADRPHDTIEPTTYPIYRKGHEPKPAISNFQFSIFNFQFQLIAATLLAACGLAAYVFIISADPPAPDDHPRSSPPLATLIESSPGAQLTTPGGFISEGRDYPRGEYTLSAGGSAEFMLTNSVNVRLRGESRLLMHHDMAVSLTRGSAEFVVPKDAAGFTVHLPDDSKIVDLGTAFRVEVDDAGHTRVRVTRGQVHWTGAQPVTLTAGQFAVKKDGQIHVAWPVPESHPLRHVEAETGIEWIVLNGHHRDDAFGTIEKTDGFKHSVDGGFGGMTSHHAPAGDGSETFTWTLLDLAPGTYELAVTWRPKTRAARVPFVINEHTAVTLDQSQAPRGPAVLRDRHRNKDYAFEVIASDVTVDETGILIVRLTNASDAPVVADAIAVRMVQPQLPEQQTAPTPNPDQTDASQPQTENRQRAGDTTRKE